MKVISDPRLSVLESVKIPFWIFDVQSLRIRWANKEALAYWKASSADEISVRDFSKDISVSVKNHLQGVLNDCIETGESRTESWTLYPEGVPHTAEAVLSPFVQGDYSALLVHIVYERKDETSDTLRSAQALMHTSAMITLYDESGTLLYSNPAARAVAKYPNERLDQKLASPKDLLDINVLLKSTGSCAMEVQVRTSSGVVWHSMNLQRSLDPVTGNYAILCSCIDISDRKKAQQEAITLAYTDSLTGLPNRVALLEHLNKLCVEGRQQFGILYLDLDRFKVVNDSLGHQIGDHLLKEIGSRLKSIMEHRVGIVSRLGGDEFVVVLEESCDREQVREIAAQVHDTLSEDVQIEGFNISIAPSLGICMYPFDGNSTTTLMQHSDVAMYAAKALKSGYQFFKPAMNVHAEKRLELEHDMVIAIKENQFELYYQPKISCDSNSISGMEALIRWIHPEKGMISPADFVPIAEETGLINKIGAWVIHEAMSQQASWKKQGFEVVVALNVSPVQFALDDFVSYIDSAAELTGSDPSLIEFEITESLLLGDDSGIKETLDSLHQRGYPIALDDFGTGYSNLAYLSAYPLTSLKIDQQFVMDIKQTAILTMIIGMGKMLNLKLVAEGVETIEQLKWLQIAGCDELQGYFFSKPMPASDATDFISSYDVTAHMYSDHSEKSLAA